MADPLALHQLYFLPCFRLAGQAHKDLLFKVSQPFPACLLAALGKEVNLAKFHTCHMNLEIKGNVVDTGIAVVVFS